MKNNKMATKKTQDKVTTIRLTENDFKRYEIMAIKEQISIAEFIRTAIKKGISKT